MPYDLTVYTDIQPTVKDSYMSLYVPTTNYGTQTTATMGIDVEKAAGYVLAAIMQFDVSSLSADLVFWGAALRVYVLVRTGSPENYTQQLWGVLRDGQEGRDEWVEAEVTANIYKTGSSWLVQGGDMTSLLATSVAGPSGINDWYQIPATAPTWNSPAVLASWVVHAIQVWNGELHLIGKGGGGGAVTDSFSFATREHATTTIRPVLRVWCEDVSTGAVQVLM